MSFQDQTRFSRPISNMEISMGIRFARGKYGCSLNADRLKRLADDVQLSRLNGIPFEQALTQALEKRMIPFDSKKHYKSALGKIFGNRGSKVRRGLPERNALSDVPLGTQFSLHFQ